MSVLRVLLVDDEPLARRELRSMLAVHPEVEVVGEADTVDAAAACVRDRAPDAVFLDIHLPPDSGFALLERIERKIRTVFVTAHDAYAIRAFEVNALDYLLKPVHPARLAEAVQRLLRETPTSDGLSRETRRATMRPDAPRPLDYGDRVFIESGARARFLSLDRIAAIRAADDYSEVVTIDGDVWLVTRSMREWEARLPAEVFLRIHRSMIVNLDHVEAVEPTTSRGCTVRVRGVAEPATMSRRHAVRVRARFDR
jgi:two-component system, LytTR family, response regulator